MSFNLPPYSVSSKTPLQKNSRNHDQKPEDTKTKTVIGKAFSTLVENLRNFGSRTFSAFRSTKISPFTSTENKTDDFDSIALSPTKEKGSKTIKAGTFPTLRLNTLAENNGTKLRYRSKAPSQKAPAKPSTPVDAPLGAVDDDSKSNGSIALHRAKMTQKEHLRKLRNDLQKSWKDFSAHIEGSPDIPPLTSLKKRLQELEQEKQGIPIEEKVLLFLETRFVGPNNLPLDSTLRTNRNVLDLIEQKPDETDPLFSFDSLVKGVPDNLVNSLVFAFRSYVDAVIHPS